ncbi:MAG: hypothetical protein ACFFDI_25555 [Promethearchaeota archaeon]
MNYSISIWKGNKLQNERIVQWIRDNEEVELNTDLADLYTFLKALLTDQQSIQVHRKISKLLKLEFTDQ